MAKPRHIGDVINDMFKTPHKVKYHKYLNSIDWKAKKTRVMQQRGGRCEKCNSSYRIEVHHKTYERIFNERLEDLEVLCFQCHRKEHNV
jgi:5-methylcytosine-specific restriction endonuclease McrA